MAILDEHRWGRVLDTGWFEWDLAVYCDSGLILKVVTAQEEHGQGRRLIRIRYQLAPTARLSVIASVSLVSLAVVALSYPRAAMAVAALVLGLGVRAWVRGLAAGARVVGLFRTQAHQMQMSDCPEEARPPSWQSGFREDAGSADDPGGAVASRPDSDGDRDRGAFVPAFPSMVALDGPSSSENTEQFA